jgi:hypothetical protein
MDIHCGFCGSGVGLWKYVVALTIGLVVVRVVVVVVVFIFVVLGLVLVGGSGAGSVWNTLPIFLLVFLGLDHFCDSLPNHGRFSPESTRVTLRLFALDIGLVIICVGFDIGIRIDRGSCGRSTTK